MAQWQDIAATLRQEVHRGGVGPGARFPTERALAERFGVARNTVRRAIATLVDDGVIVRQVGSGSFVQAPVPERANGSADHVLAQIIGVSPRDLMDVRLLLEPRAAALAAIHGNSAELERIVAAEAAARAETELEAFERCDAEFHQRIVAASHNELLLHLCGLMSKSRSSQEWLDMKRRAFSAERLAGYDDDHGAVLDALVRRDPEAAEAAMRQHLEAVRANLFARAAD